MTLHRVVPPGSGSIDLDAPDARSTLLDWYDPHDTVHLRLNLVSTLDGRAAGADGTSESLTSRADRTILGVIREQSDLVLVGAESVRREGYLRPKRAALAVVTATGDLRGHRLEAPRPEYSEHPLIILTTDHGARRARTLLPSAHIVVLDGEERVNVHDLMSALRRAGYGRIVAEGGPSMAAQLVEAGLVDELCLTIMPRVGGPALSLLTALPLSIHHARPAQLLVDDAGAQFGRWTLTDARHE